MSETPGFTTIREAAVRLQADAVVVYSVTSDIYYKYKVFAKTDVKAFATTQLMLMDVRTGLIPFSTIVTRDTVMHARKDSELQEAGLFAQNAAAINTFTEAGQQLHAFLQQK